jgi:transcriptional regulator with XRE-family HTH domain
MRYDRAMARSYEVRSTAASLLRLARMKAGLSQAALAARADVPPTMISAYERDQRQPTLETLMRLLKAAGFELRMHLEPYDDHDDVLAVQRSTWTPEDHDRFAAMLESWRQAAPTDS